MRRMDRYKDDNNNFHVKRSDKNQDLYQNVSSNPKYTNITDVTNANAFEINNRDRATYSSRESYQKMKKYQNMEPIPRSKKELDDVNYLYQKHENKVYDINSVLEEARKNRQERDALEEKRKLKNTSYNILAGLNAEELEKYREEKEKNRVEKPGDNELRELIDTITSKTLAGEIDKATSVDLLSDLMATNILDKVEKPTEIEDKEKELKEEIKEEKEPEENMFSSKEVLDKEQLKEVEKRNEEELQKTAKTVKEADKDFYTRSMDLSDKDFDLSDEFKEKPLPLPVKILIFLLIVAIISVAAYFIYQRM
ncbi:MAG: hypothetical protein HFE81_01805 [Bacilli bacterium]|nr:hypothetical protein [Bacilli bacterium]